MKHYKLPFKLSVERKYNELNIYSFPSDWAVYKKEHKIRGINMDNQLHIELSKFKTFDITVSEIVDLSLRYALGKHEFRKLAAELITIKSKSKR